MTSLRFSAVINSALLKPPSILSIFNIGDEIAGKEDTKEQRASMLNVA